MAKQQPQTSAQLLIDLKALMRPDKAEFLPRFFKTGPGEYAEGDKFLGVVVPDQRKTARQFREMPLDQIRAGLHSPWHEMRLSSLFILQHQFSRADPKRQDELIAFYLDNLDHVNNWDLVDCSAPQTLGVWLPHDAPLLHRKTGAESAQQVFGRETDQFLICPQCEMPPSGNNSRLVFSDQAADSKRSTRVIQTRDNQTAPSFPSSRRCNTYAIELSTRTDL